MSDKVIEGQPLHFDMISMRISCCSCGLSHVIVLDERDGVPKLRFYIDEHKTNEQREEKKQ